MARNIRTVVDIIDDFTGEVDPTAETFGFTHRGITYELDLGPGSAALLDQALEPFISVARKVKKATKKPPPRAASAQSNELKQIREWARRNGHDVASAGRIDGTVIAAYRAAQQSPAEPGLETRTAS